MLSPHDRQTEPWYVFVANVGFGRCLNVRSCATPRLQTEDAWNTRRPRRRSGDVWLWDQPALQQEIFFLRRATSAEGFSAIEH
jgi:hypothetical protein